MESIPNEKDNRFCEVGRGSPVRLIYLQFLIYNLAKRAGGPVPKWPA